MKPSEVRVIEKGAALPLIGSAFGRTEREIAAALLVLACAHAGDEFGPRQKKEIDETIIREVLTEGGSLAHLMTNPFVPMPDFRDLADRGFARFLGSPDDAAAIEFTDKGLTALTKFLRPKEANDGS